MDKHADHSAGKSATAASPTDSTLFLAQRVDLMMSAGRTSSSIALGSALLVFGVFAFRSTSPALWWWFGLVLATNLARLTMFARYRRAGPERDLAFWLRLHHFTGAATGMAWGLLPLHPTAGLGPAYDALVLVIPTFLATGALNSYSVFPLHYRSFVLAVFGTAITCHALQNGTQVLAPDLILPVVGVGLYGMSRRFHGHLLETMAARASQEAVNLRLQETNAELARHHEQHAQEQALASHVFANLISGTDADIPGVACWSRGMGDFSGDLALTARGPDGRIYLMLCDFTGHGLPAALGAVPAANIFLSMARKGLDLGAIAQELHTRLSTLLPVGYFCCAALIATDASGRGVRIFNAGLPPLLLRRAADGSVEAFPSQHLPLGISADEVETIDLPITPLAPGDRLLAYTDGLIESTNAADEAWGHERLQAFLRQQQSGGSLLPLMQQELERFVGDTAQADDISLIELRVPAA